MNRSMPPSPPWGRLRTLRRMAAGDAAFFRSLHESHGDVVCFELPHQKHCAVFSVDAIHEVLVDKIGSFEVHHPRTAFEVVQSDCLARTLVADEHRRLRELILTAFTPERTAAFQQVCAAEANRLSDEFQQGQTVDARKKFESFTWNAMATCLIGGGRGMAEAMLPALTALKLNWIMSAVGLGTLLGRLPLPHDLWARRKVRPLDQVAYKCIREASRASDAHRSSLISHLVRATEEESADWSFANDREIRDEIYGILLGALDHPIRVLTQSTLRLARNPKVRDRLEAEVEQVLGNRQLRGEDLNHLTYTHAVCKELLRLHPAGTLLTPRRALEDCTLGGYLIPRGTLVIVGVDVVNQRPDYWGDGDTFRPDRWENADGCPHDAFLTFSMEPRRCRGVDLATAIIVSGLAAVAQTWRLEPVSDTPPSAGLKPGGFRGSVPCLVTRRPGPSSRLGS